MHVEQLKYTIWAADPARATAFYQKVFEAEVVRQNPHITELAVAGGRIAIHGGGEGAQTWTGLSFQVADVVAGASEVIAAGGKCPRAPQPENGEAPHLALCEDTDGNQIMLTRKRG
jgi:predicted enzyme related to lactoylglutathione lyase